MNGPTSPVSGWLGYRLDRLTSCVAQYNHQKRPDPASPLHGVVGRRIRLETKAHVIVRLVYE